MSAGYGRGHYGGEQLDRPTRSGGGWFKIAAIAGVGAAIWYMWPRKSPELVYMPPSPPPSPPPPPSPTAPTDTALEQIAHERGFISAKAYEDSVLASARDLRASGAKIELAPHLQHLTLRLEGGS